jgi:hypothetical protein
MRLLDAVFDRIAGDQTSRVRYWLAIATLLTIGVPLLAGVLLFICAPLFVTVLIFGGTGPVTIIGCCASVIWGLAWVHTIDRFR